MFTGDRSKWKTVEGEFNFFLAANGKKVQIVEKPHSPNSELSDGCMDLLTLPKSNRLDLANALTCTPSYGFNVVFFVSMMELFDSV